MARQSIKTQIEVEWREFSYQNRIDKGIIPNTSKVITGKFKDYLKGSVPVTEASLGRVLSRLYHRAQDRKTSERVYFLNRTL